MGLTASGQETWKFVYQSMGLVIIKHVQEIVKVGLGQFLGHVWSSIGSIFWYWKTIKEGLLLFAVWMQRELLKCNNMY